MKLKQSLIIAITVGVLAVTAWELYWRSQGIQPNLDDNKNLWAYQRAKLDKDPSNLVVFIGSSRILYDIQLDVWRERTNTDPVMLAVQGASPIPIFKDIVENTNYSGPIVVGITPGLFFSTTYPKAGPIKRAQSKVDYYFNRTYAQRINHRLSVPLQTNLAFIRDGDEAWDNDVDLKTLLSKIHFGSRIEGPGPPFNNFEEISLDRHMKMPDYVTNDTVYANSIKAVWKDILTSELPPPDKDGTIAAFVDLYKKFKARGGQIVLLRCPSSGFFREIEKKGVPRTLFWDELVKKTNSQSYHFEDYEQYLDLNLPEWSHLSTPDARFFTKELIKILKSDQVLSTIN